MVAAMRRRAALGAAVLVLAAMAQAAEAAAVFGGECAKDSDCDTGLCNVYFTVRGSPRRPRTRRTRTIFGARQCANTAAAALSALHIPVPPARAARASG